MTNKIHLILNWTMIMVNLFIIFFIFTLFYPYEPVTLNKPVTSVKEVYRSNEDICLQMDFTKNMDIAPSIEFYLVNGFVLTLEDSSYSRPTGDNTVVSCKKIPHLDPGEYRIDINLEYEVYPWRTIYHTWSSSYFEVI